MSDSSRIHRLSLHDALPIWTFRTFEHTPRQLRDTAADPDFRVGFNFVITERNFTEIRLAAALAARSGAHYVRSEEHTSELQSRLHLVCRLLLDKKQTYYDAH